MKNVYTVRQVNSYIKNMFAQDFMLNRIYVKGEVSNLKYHTSGHIYFSLKDESGTIACVMFAGSRSGLSFRMEEGQQIIVLGVVDVYARDGKYQLYARKIVRDGVGLLYERFELLKKELQEMGMFAPEYKQKIPKYIRRLGVVTAPTGAAVRDIINITKRRNPFVQIILYPALVQGEGAAESIVKGIHALEAEKVDVMIVGRGGGSMEDLWAFNEEAVARAVFDCSVPVISAVGHETDTTIIDFVADLRAPTPSAAAELAVYDFMEMKKNLKLREEKLLHFMQLILERKRQKLEQYSLRMRAYHPQQRLNEQRQFAADVENRLRREMMRRLEQEKYRLGLMAERLKGLSPLEKLSQGYAYVENSSGANVRTVSNVKQGEQITVYVTDGRIRAEVTGVEKEET
ncbi:exodeoxyribonuclease VII large subunit [[Ruminococcus] lactaris]|uniref:Exodeoxyribonuclease 7 large subunit n=1 Tax=[Ruminococcus] lactaris TaxID=46228 RepID=A0A3E4LZU8_9FIRM|nr:exodeoxyribonuclease VII large subunit [[Ruminococcus] lactaris]RGK42765.1 exodeoxyribonuclease VII large subunit [[Ruminococcus] lactaris]